jgi:hypothetical protein
MQDVYFRTVDDCLDYLPEDQLAITLALREILLQTIPNVVERLSYNVPYYKRFSHICFIWPGAIPWGSTTRAGVRLGFTKGYLIDDDIGYLDKGNRKQVCWHDFQTISDLDHDLITMYILMASEIDARKGRP